jgi:lia operon protein LiaF
MRNKGQIVMGSILVGLGLIFLIGTVFRIDVWSLCFPLGLIVLGVWLVFRPRVSGEGTNSQVILLGDERRKGAWDVRDQELWFGIADIELDLVHAIIPPGETRFRLFGFVGDVDIWLPAGVGVSVEVNGFVIDTEVLGRSLESIFTPMEYVSDDYASAEQKVRIEMTSFVADLKIKQL